MRSGTIYSTARSKKVHAAAAMQQAVCGRWSPPPERRARALHITRSRWSSARPRLILEHVTPSALNEELAAKEKGLKHSDPAIFWNRTTFEATIAPTDPIKVHIYVTHTTGNVSTGFTTQALNHASIHASGYLIINSNNNLISHQCDKGGWVKTNLCKWITTCTSDLK